MLHQGFGVRTLICDTAPEAAWLARTGLTRDALRELNGIEAYSTELDALLPQADLVTIHLPLTPETRDLISSRRLNRMKPGSALINVGRGGIVDEAALYDALVSGHLAGAATDVFVTEPYVPVTLDKDLRTLSNIVFTPHCGSDTVEANARMAGSAMAQASTFLAGNLNGLSLVPLTP